MVMPTDPTAQIPILTAPPLDLSPSSADIRWALVQFTVRAGQYRLYRDYYDGTHRLVFATEKFRNAFGPLFRALAVNLMPAVVAALVDRLQVEGFEATDGAEGINQEARAIWEANKMSLRAGEVHLEAARAGDAYVIVWPDRETGAPTIYPQRATQMVVRYDDEQPGVIAVAAKAWTLLPSRQVRLTLYYPDRIERYITRGAAQGLLPASERAFVPYDDADDGGVVVANPYGRVPVFHFTNNGEIGGYGRSELHDAIPLQDVLNKTIADMLVGQEFAAMPQRWATGIEVPIDSDPESPTYGKPKALPWKPGIDRIWMTANEQASFGQFDAANLSQLREAATEAAAWICRITGVPMHHFFITTGEFPSGESQRQAEGRLLQKVSDRQVAWGAEWADVIAFALRIARPAAGAAPVRLATTWTDAAPRSAVEDADVELKEWQTAVLKSGLGVSNRQIMLEGDYTDEQIDQFAVEKATEAEAAVARAQQAFDAGNVTLPNAPPQQQPARRSPFIGAGGGA